MASSDEAIEAIYAAGLDPAGWSDAVERIGALFHTATGALYVEDHSARPSLLNAGIIFGHSSAAVASYGEHYCALNPFNRVASSYDVGVLSDTKFDRTFGHESLFASSEYYADWARPQSIRHVIGQRVRSVNEAVLCAAFWRSADAGPFSNMEVAEFERLIRHVNRAIDVGGRLQTAEAEMEAMLGRSSAAVLTLGPDGRIRHCNAVAQALLGAGCALSLRDDRLCTAVPQDQAALDRLIACAFDPRRAAWAENARLAIRRTDARAPLLTQIVAVAHHLGPFAPDRAACAVLTIQGFESETAPRTERLRRRFALTATQARLALALRSGLSLRGAARELGIGQETARSHLKAVFARTDTHRQAELVLLLRNLDER